MFTNILNRCEQQDEKTWTEFSTFFRLSPNGIGAAEIPINLSQSDNYGGTRFRTNCMPPFGW